MPFQSNVRLTQGFGVQGEKLYTGPWRSAMWELISSPQPNVIGATAYTVLSEGKATAGGAGVFAGLLANPKQYANFTANGGLASTLVLPDDSMGELVTMGYMLVFLTTAAAIGDQIVYTTTTGALSSIGAAATPGAGLTLVPTARVVLRASAANALAIIELNN